MKSASAVPGIITSVYVTTGGGRTGNGGGNGTAGTQDEIDFEWKGKTPDRYSGDLKWHRHSGDPKGRRLCHQDRSLSHHGLHVMRGVSDYLIMPFSFTGNTPTEVQTNVFVSGQEDLQVRERVYV